jgi:hypothetical protein
MTTEPNLKIVADSLQRVRNGIAYFTGGCFLVAAIAAGIGFSQQKLTPMIIGLGGAAAGAGLLSFGFFLHYARIESVPVYRVLRDTPEEIVWFYEGNTRNRVEGIQVSTEHWIAIHLRNGKCLQLRSIHPTAIQPILDTVRQRAPNAVFGYSQAIAQQYRQDPNSL